MLSNNSYWSVIVQNKIQTEIYVKINQQLYSNCVYYIFGQYLDDIKTKCKLRSQIAIVRLQSGLIYVPMYVNQCMWTNACEQFILKQNEFRAKFRHYKWQHNKIESRGIECFITEREFWKLRRNRDPNHVSKNIIPIGTELRNGEVN